MSRTASPSALTLKSAEDAETLARDEALPAPPTPMMAQYLEIKTANPDCLLFYRMGDFYELFFEDAEVASRALGIVLTKRGKHAGADIRMCGVPVDRRDDYLHRLIALGHRVAVCEQIEDPAEARKRGPKSVVRRRVERLVTPGTITEERLLDPDRASILAAVAFVREARGSGLYGVASLDISTGAFSISEVDAAGLFAEIARLEPREVVAPQSLFDEPAFARGLAEMKVATAPLGREPAGEDAEREIREYFGVATLEGFGQFSAAETKAAAVALAYLRRTQFAALPTLDPPRRRRHGEVLEIDPATRVNLELTRTAAGERAGSLLAAMDATLTPGGARLLAERLAGPLTDLTAIRERHDAIASFAADLASREALRKALRSAPDILRALGRLGVDRGGPRDLRVIHDGIETAADVAGLLARDEEPPSLVLAAYAALGRDLRDLLFRLASQLVDEPSANRRDGGFIKRGALPDLDAARSLRDDSRRVVTELQSQYSETTGVRQLKIKHNNFLGYFIETPQAAGETLLRPPHSQLFMHRQTMAGSMRFSTVELGGLEAKIAEAGERALALELEAFEDLKARVAAADEALRGIAAAFAELDVHAGLAELAVKRNWVRPLVDDTLAFVVDGGRHPVVEAALAGQGEPFVPNSVDLSGDGDTGGRIAIVTGPNMAGKSTFLRQNAVIAIMAQMGSFVPARSARIGLVDRLFSRVGAADDLARGRSTFMVEMVETAAILNQATKRSFVILDEIGRGTATYDGLSIASAVVEHLNSTNRSRSLFATHFHELTKLAASMPRATNLAMRAAEHKGKLVFLHEVAPGTADRSYGIQVAKLAGLPASVVRRAQTLLTALERSDDAAAKIREVDAMPLFSHSNGDAAKPDPLRDRLDDVDPDALSPRDAHAFLYELKRLAAD